ncbi:YcxB family protein [Actinoplanes oblitus]|uniref:YcxB family protein n=1 Tax=Actinoplanes oblitus TaxID=3040509 RepID=A0ABY8W9A9_9ACTN|nr:YcxB family protein [Actinoplanes oblitus]WIM93552.1 YcxB family protein [Actinoplanes oblitus]
MSSARFRWADFHRLTVWPQAYLLHLGNGVLIDIPREPLSDEDASALRDHLTGLGLLTA